MVCAITSIKRSATEKNNNNNEETPTIPPIKYPSENNEKMPRKITPCEIKKTNHEK